MSKRILAGISAGLLFSALISGCSSGSDTSVVTGSVKLDGQPLPKGEIRFVAVDGAAATAGAAIADGQFTATVSPGEKKIEISAPKVAGKRKMYDTPDSPTVDVVEELLPPRYNTQSALTMTVQPGEQEKTFELQSK